MLEQLLYLGMNKINNGIFFIDVFRISNPSSGLKKQKKKTTTIKSIYKTKIINISKYIPHS